MNNTPTPRTDEFSKTAYDTDIDDYVAYNKAVAFAQNLETELTAVTEQRDRLAEAMRKIQKVGLVAVDAFDELDRIDEIVDEALAAVKGGADE
jgi:hypothetical protein